MDQSQLNQLKNNISTLEDIDIKAEILKFYPDINQIIEGSITPEIFICDYKKMITGLKILSNNQEILRYSHFNNIAGRDLNSSLINLNSYLKNSYNSISNALYEFREIKFCLDFFNLWEGTVPNDIDISKLNRTFLKLYNSYSKIKENNENLYIKQKERVAALDSFEDRYTKLSIESDQISNELKDNNQKLDGYKEQTFKIQGQIEQQNENIETSQKELNTTIKSVKEEIIILQQETEEYEELKKKIEKEKKLYRESNEELKDLLGIRKELEILRGFDKRKKELYISTTIWGGMSIAGFVLLWYLMIKAFPNIEFSAEKSLLENLAPLIILSFRVFPLIIFLGIIFKQYSNERSLLESYAFKAAQVLVIDNHAEKLKSCKDEFLSSTLGKVHEEPFNKNNSTSNFKIKDIQKHIGTLEKILKIFDKKGMNLSLLKVDTKNEGENKGK